MDSITAISAGTRPAQQGLLYQSLYADAGGPVRSAARLGEPRLERRLLLVGSKDRVTSRPVPHSTAGISVAKGRNVSVA